MQSSLFPLTVDCIDIGARSQQQLDTSKVSVTCSLEERSCLVARESIWICTLIEHFEDNFFAASTLQHSSGNTSICCNENTRNWRQSPLEPSSSKSNFVWRSGPASALGGRRFVALKVCDCDSRTDPERADSSRTVRRTGVVRD
eukprot:m.137592 g.137592  ORF g.137592 m.137592 type:complete len:144 (+) comp9931_c1_seq4:2037-2468(+)